MKASTSNTLTDTRVDAVEIFLDRFAKEEMVLNTRVGRKQLLALSNRILLQMAKEEIVAYTSVRITTSDPAEPR